MYQNNCIIISMFLFEELVSCEKGSVCAGRGGADNGLLNNFIDKNYQYYSSVKSTL